METAFQKYYILVDIRPINCSEKNEERNTEDVKLLMSERKVYFNDLFKLRFKLPETLSIPALNYQMRCKLRQPTQKPVLFLGHPEHMGVEEFHGACCTKGGHSTNRLTLSGKLVPKSTRT